MKRVNLDDLVYYKALYYGQPGSTKTRTAASAALDDRTAPVLQLDVGGNPLSIRNYERKPDIVSIEALEDLNPIYAWLLAGQPEPPSASRVAQLGLRPGYKTVIVDGITDLQRISFGLVTGNRTKGPGDVPTSIERQHYGQVLAQMTNFARLFFVNLPMHVIITALEKEDVEAATGVTRHRPLLLGQSASEVGAYAYVVARLTHASKFEKRDLRDTTNSGENPTADTTSVAFFKPSSRIVAKDQIGIGVPFMFDPTMTKIMDHIERNTKRS